MGNKTTIVEGKPIIISQYSDPYQPETDVPETMKRIGEYIAKHKPEKPVYSIADVSDISLSFSQMMVGSAELVRDPASLGVDLAMLKIVVVTGGDEMAKLGSDALSSQEQYGQLQMPTFDTLEEALAYIDEEMSKES